MTPRMIRLRVDGRTRRRNGARVRAGIISTSRSPACSAASSQTTGAPIISAAEARRRSLRRPLPRSPIASVRAAPATASARERRRNCVLGGVLSPERGSRLVARIRSIQPEFFTSETIAALPLSTRLTFIGLWTYVDDNGVGHDNELLITAAIWPLERDNLETLARTREDLASLSRIGLVSRYRDSRKGYVYVTSWDEHQKVDHPRKPRYPRPCDVPYINAPASENEAVDETLATDSRPTRASVAPE